MGLPIRAGLVAFCLVLTWASPASSQSFETFRADLPKHEFRGAWIATVWNLDWPSRRGLGTSDQQLELTRHLDRLRASGINAVFLQVRAECDALYPSEIEPWSYHLTGQQGRAPDPYYDPLEFAVSEAHKRGIELHAWMNPFRAEAVLGAYSMSASHVTAQQPDWVITMNDTLRFLDPGLPAVRDYVTSVAVDVVQRYDVDGVHFDDYFYPYPPNHISSLPPQNAPDYDTYLTYGGGSSSIHDWRRENINALMRQVSDGIRAVDPSVKFGVSPFGVWRNGVPSGIQRSLSSVDVVYADAPQWTREESVDYLAPQLYWQIGGDQDFRLLAPWWLSQSHDRHVYAGHGLYKNDRDTWWGSLFSPSEIPNQIRFARSSGLQGSVFFRTENITVLNSMGFADSLSSDLFRSPALTPVMQWRDVTAPAKIDDLAFEWTSEDQLTLLWSPPTVSAFEAEARRFAVYRVRSSEIPDFGTAIQSSSNLLAVIGDTMLVDRPGMASDPYYYVVTGVSANSVEGAESDYVVVDGRAVGVEVTTSVAFALQQNYPNPFRGSTRLRFHLDHSTTVSLQVFNLVGQRVAGLINSEALGAGLYESVWDARDDGGRPIASGTYFAVLDAGGRRSTIGMVYIR
jgi:uncharacterized lipoprotein YddW (UPF0748 family)